MKRIFSILLLSALLLTSCASTTADSSDTSAETSTAETTAETTADNSPAYAVKDYDGYNYRVMAIDMLEGTRIDEISEVNGTGDISSDIIADALYERMLAVNELYNITTERVGVSLHGQIGDQLLTSIMANEDSCDIAFINAYGLPKLLTVENALINLNSVPELDFSNEWWDANSVKDMSIGDNLFAVTGDINIRMLMASVITLFNKQIAEEFHLDDMYDDVRDGTWTIERVREYSEQVKTDTNGDGNINQDDLVPYMYEPATLTNYMQGAGLRLVENDNDGYPEYSLDVNRQQSLVERTVTLMKSGYNAFKLGDVNVYTNIFSSGRALFWSNQLYLTLDFRSMEQDYGILPIPKLDESQDGYNTSTDRWHNSFTVMPVTVSDASRAGCITEGTAALSLEMVTPVIYDISLKDKLIRDEGSQEMLEIISASRVYDVAFLFAWGGFEKMMNSLTNDLNSDFASSYAAIEEKFHTEMAATLEVLK